MHNILREMTVLRALHAPRPNVTVYQCLCLRCIAVCVCVVLLSVFTLYRVAPIRSSFG